ncbi:MAG: hypothetical protein ACYDAK_13635 [Candidatus Limnocylindrales bacterium]
MFLVACNPASSPAPATTATPVAGGFDALDFYRQLGGDTGITTFKTDIPSVRSAADWRRLVESGRKDLGRLPVTERQELLAGAVKAYLRFVTDEEYDVRVAGQRVGIVQNVYDTNADQMPRLVANLTRLDKVTWYGGAQRPFPDPNAPRETRSFFSFHTDASPTEQFWSLKSAGWQCSSLISSGYGSIELVRVLELVAIASSGTVQGVADLHGRRVTLIRVPFAKSFLIYWLDSSTFWPVKIEFPAIAADPAADAIVAGINQRISIAAPRSTC